MVKMRIFVWFTLSGLFCHAYIHKRAIHLASRRENATKEILIGHEKAVTFQKTRDKRDIYYDTPRQFARTECCKEICDYEERREVGSEMYNALFEVHYNEGRSCSCKGYSSLSDCLSSYFCSKHTEFYCGPAIRQCVPGSYHCDSDNDCSDWRDEIGCSTKHSHHEIRSATKLKYGYYGAVTVRNRPICDDGWTNNNARVVCTSLGYPSNSIALAWHGENVNGKKGVGGFILDDVTCRGDENDLKQCSHRTYHNCGNSEGAAAICLRPSSLSLQGNIRRRGMVYLRGLQVCGRVSDSTANVICKQLFKGVVKSNNYIYKLTSPIYMKLRCNGNEESIEKCDVGVTKTCSLPVAYIACKLCSDEDILLIAKKVQHGKDAFKIKQSIETAITELNRCEIYDCSSITKQNNAFCQTKAFLEKMLTQVRLLDTKPNVIDLDWSIDHVGKLRFNFMKQSFSQLSVQIDRLGVKITTSLGTYLERLAEFDRAIAKPDLSTLRNLNTVAKTEAGELAVDLEWLMKWSFCISNSDMVSKVAVLAVRMASLFNPINWLTGDQSAIDVKTAVSDVAVQGNLIAQLQYVKDNAFPKLEGLASDMYKRMRKNKASFKIFENFFKTQGTFGLTSEQSKLFLSIYRDFEAPIKKRHIAEYRALLDVIVQKLCEVIENPSEELGAMLANAPTSQGLCPRTKVKVAKLVSIYEEIEEHQVELIERFVALARASLAMDAARAVKQSITGSAQDKLKRHILKMEVYFVLRVHRITLTNNACNYLRYVNYDQDVPACKNARKNPYADISSIINTKSYDMCKCPNCFKVKKTVNIPTTMTGVKGSVNIQTLLSQNGSSLLEIPNESWLKRNKWLTGAAFLQAPFYLKKLNVYIPPGLNRRHSFGIRVEHLASNFDKNRKYLFKNGLFIDNYYMYDDQSCIADNPYSQLRCSVMFPRICKITEGTINSQLLPRLEGSLWKIKLKSDIKLPQIFSASTFKLRASAEFCYKAKNSFSRKPMFFITKAQSSPCCNGSSQTACKNCPASSIRRMNSLFCEQCPVGFEPSATGNYGCTSCLRNTYKATPGPAACQACVGSTVSAPGAARCAKPKNGTTY